MIDLTNLTNSKEEERVEYAARSIQTHAAPTVGGRRLHLLHLRQLLLQRGGLRLEVAVEAAHLFLRGQAAGD